MNNSCAPSTILCIEDELALLEELVEELSAKGHRVLAAQDSIRAEQILADEQPDLILCDVMLPGRDGFELLTEWRRAGHISNRTAFIFLTALSDREPRLMGLKAGANDYIPKPVDLDVLHLKIENTLAYGRGARNGVVAPKIHLSRRERQVLALLGHGERTAAIAFQLEISEHTVNQYIKEVYRKLSLSNRADAARAAVALGLVKPGN